MLNFVVNCRCNLCLQHMHSLCCNADLGCGSHQIVNQSCMVTGMQNDASCENPLSDNQCSILFEEEDQCQTIVRVTLDSCAQNKCCNRQHLSMAKSALFRFPQTGVQNNTKMMPNTDCSFFSVPSVLLGNTWTSSFLPFFPLLVFLTFC